MTPDEIGRILAQAAHRATPEGDDNAAAERAAAAILGDLRPVRPLAPVWVFTLTLLVVFAAFAAASAAALGLAGVRALGPPQRTLIFSTLLATAWLAAAACARQMRPASGRNLSSLALAVASLVFPIVFALLFHDYGTVNFVKGGIPCLRAGLAVAIPTGLAIAWILRRGFVLDWTAAGLAAGALAGLAGLGMLELHCPNLNAIHVITWHVAVVVSSGALGFVAGKIASHRPATR
jgi:hypothetical protein